MSQIPNDLRFASTHEWVRLDDDTEELIVGISDHAQQLLGDMVYIETPEVDSEFEAGENCGVLESVKAASDLYCPVNGVIVDVNARLVNEPDLINTDPYGEGWLFRVKPEDIDDLDDLMDSSEYEQRIAGDDIDSDDDNDDNDDDDEDDDNEYDE